MPSSRLTFLLLSVCFIFAGLVLLARADDNDLTNGKEIRFGVDPNGTVDERIVLMEPDSVLKLVFNPSFDVRFAVFQAHAQYHQVTMSYDSVLLPDNHINGSSIGLLRKTSSVSPKDHVFLFNHHSFNVTLLVFVVPYGKAAPIPGGCNLELNVETAPWLNVFYNQNIVFVEHEPAALPTLSNWLGSEGTPSCETSSLRYEVFHLYLGQRDFSQESFFNAIRMLRTPEVARKNGREIRSFGFTPSTRSLFSMYPGIGRAFVVTVTYTGDDKYPVAAYVPSFSYGCDLSQEEDCQNLNTVYSKILCALSLFVGLFIAFMGHRYFQLEMFIVGFITFATISYITLVNHFDTNVAGLAAGTSVMGVLGGLLWWFVWWYWGIPALSVLLVVLELGFLLASVVFYLPISFEFLTHDFNFWSAFFCSWLVLPVIFITFTRLANIISCAVLGSYAVIIPIDHYIGSSLKYIIVNIVRRATIRGFGRTVLDPPYQDNDLILTIAWVGLSVSGIVFQYVRERKRPPFSPPADMWRRTGYLSEQTPLISETVPNHYSAT